MIKKLLIGFAILGCFLSGCREQKPVYSNFTGYAQGSTYSIVFENRNNIDPEQLRQNVEKILDRFDLSLSVYNDSSILSRINRNENAVPDSFFVELFRKSAALSRLTEGAFDITVGPLVNAWGFGPDKHKSFTENKRDSLLKLVGMDKVSIVNGSLVKSDPHIILDFNAIAQGYSVDVVCRFFDKTGIKNYLVEIGGEVRGKGRKAGNLWRIGIDKPVDDNMVPGQNLEAIVKITDEALSTSGNYRKFYIEDGVKYSHEINPKTGYPAKNTVLSATVIADDCATADALATAFMVMGKDKTIEFLGIHPEFEAFLVFSDPAGNFKTWATERLKKDISESESSQ